MRASPIRRLHLPLLLAATLLGACRPARPAADADSAASAANGATAAALPPEALRRLRWLEGSWRGVDSANAAAGAFHERYVFVDDSTMEVESFRDSTMTEVTERARYELRAGRLASAGAGPGWVAASVDADGSARFAPVRGARNAFTWRRVSPDAWEAELTWPARDAGGAGQRRLYRLTRWPPGAP